MTIIAAASWNREVWIASDLAGTNGWGLQVQHHDKVIEYEWGAVGFAGSYRILQAIEHDLAKVEGVQSWAEAARLVEIVETGLMRCGWSRSCADDLPKVNGLGLLFASKGGAIWNLQSDLSLLPCKNYGAVGTGAEVALGSLFTVKRAGWDPSTAVDHAVRAAVEHDASCAGRSRPLRVR